MVVAVAGCALFTERETFGKGALQRRSAFVSARRDARVIGTWHVSLGKRGLSREKWLLAQDFPLEGGYPEIAPLRGNSL